MSTKKHKLYDVVTNLGIELKAAKEYLSGIGVDVKQVSDTYLTDEQVLDLSQKLASDEVILCVDDLSRLFSSSEELSEISNTVQKVGVRQFEGKSARAMMFATRDDSNHLNLTRRIANLTEGLGQNLFIDDSFLTSSFDSFKSKITEVFSLGHKDEEGQSILSEIKKAFLEYLTLRFYKKAIGKKAGRISISFYIDYRKRIYNQIIHHKNYLSNASDDEEGVLCAAA